MLAVAFSEGKCPLKGAHSRLGTTWRLLAYLGAPQNRGSAKAGWLWCAGAPPSVCSIAVMIIIINKMRQTMSMVCAKVPQ
jgi:hypothetical protein